MGMENRASVIGREPKALVDEKDPNPVSAAGPEGQQGVAIGGEGYGHHDEDAVPVDPSTREHARAVDGVISQAGPAASSTDGSGDEAAADMEQHVPRLHSKELEALLDESMGDLVVLEDFDGEVNDRANESHWLGIHLEHSLSAIRVELVRKGRYTAHIDDAGNLLSDPEEYRLAVEIGVQITLSVHRARTEDQKLEFILRLQAGKRFCTYEEQRELTNNWILVRLRLGVDYETIAKTFKVHPNTVRNVETRAAADTNSKLGITKTDRRQTWSTDENKAEAHRLRAEGKKNSEIAKALGTTPATVGKLFKVPGPQSKAKTDRKAKSSLGTSSAQPAQMTEDIAVSDGVPRVHRLAVQDLGLDAQGYMELVKAERARALEDSKAVADEKHENLKQAVYHAHMTEIFNSRLQPSLAPAGEAGADEAPGDSGPDGAEYEVGTVLRGFVTSIAPDGVFVALPLGGGGVIDNRDPSLTWQAPPDEGEEFRVRVKGFDSTRRLWELGLLGRQTVAPAAGASAAGADLDERYSPYAELTGLKAGPKKKEVIR